MCERVVCDHLRVKGVCVCESGVCVCVRVEVCVFKLVKDLCVCVTRLRVKELCVEVYVKALCVCVQGCVRKNCVK